MEKTQKLLGIALAVIALDGCRPSSPDPSATPTPSAHAGATMSTGVRRTMGGGGAAAAAVFYGGQRRPAPPAAEGYTRVLTAPRSGFGGSGFHGGG